MHPSIKSAAVNDERQRTLAVDQIQWYSKYQLAERGD